MRLFALIFGLIGAGAAGKGVIDLWHGMATHGWSETTGVVLESNIESRRSGRPRRRSRTYRPVITYQYEVANRTLTANRYRIATLSGPRGMAETAQRAFPVGASVTVRYNPGQPEEAVLVTGPGGGVWLMLGLGAVFGTVGGGLLWSTVGATPVRVRSRPRRSRRRRMGVRGTLAALGIWGGMVYFLFVRTGDSGDLPTGTAALASADPAPPSGQPFTISALGRGYSIEGEFSGRVAHGAESVTLHLDRALLVGTTRVREAVVVQYLRAQLGVESGRSWSTRAQSGLIVVGDTVAAGDSLFLSDLAFSIPADDAGRLDDKMVVFEIGLRRPHEETVRMWTYARSPVGLLAAR